MKSTFSLPILLLLTIQIGFAQNNSSFVDEHVRLRNLVINDPQKALADAYMLNKSSEKDLIGLSNLISGNVMWAVGEFPKALNNYYKALEHFEDAENQYGKITTYNDLSLIHLDEKDFNKALEQINLALELNTNYKDKWLEAVMTSNKGDIFLKSNILDSARFYTHKSYDIALELGDNTLLPFILKNLGKISFLTGSREGIDYLNKALIVSREIDDHLHEIEILSELGDFYLNKNQADSAKIYIMAALRKSNTLGSKKNDLVVTEKLIQLYELTGKYDSAFYNSKKARLLKDSLLGVDKILLSTHLEQLEQIRQAEIEMEEEAQMESRRQLIQYLFIGLLILLFVALLFIMKRINISDYWFEFIIVVTLLMVFEFINLLIHTYAAEVTHHSPFLMLIILVSIASILGPIHHHSMKFARKKFLSKNL